MIGCSNLFTEDVQSHVDFCMLGNRSRHLSVWHHISCPKEGVCSGGGPAFSIALVRSKAVRENDCFSIPVVDMIDWILAFLTSHTPNVMTTVGNKSP